MIILNRRNDTFVCCLYSGECSCIQTISLGRSLVLSLALILIPTVAGNSFVFFMPCVLTLVEITETFQQGSKLHDRIEVLVSAVNGCRRDRRRSFGNGE